MKILVLNAGSSSQKSCLYELTDNVLPAHPPEPLWTGFIDWTKVEGQGLLTVKAQGQKQEMLLASGDRPGGIRQMLNTLISMKVLADLNEIQMVGHRVVHGGAKYTEATLIDPSVKAAIQELFPLAPEHNPAHLEGITAIEQVLGTVPQVAVFDTAFHSQMPPSAAVYPIPYEWFIQGVRRYGFHGISHQYCAQRAAQFLAQPLASLRIVTCHLGNGCSLAAVQEGKSIDTTMGFTPLEGVMMGSRSGSIDPAILLYLMREHQLTASQLNQLLNKESGLKGLSGLSADMRSILTAMEEGQELATLAFQVYIHRLKAAIAAMTASLGGLDVLVFTAGVGENAAPVRSATCQGLEFLGIQLDPALNAACSPDADIAQPHSPVRILVLHTAEDWAIAQTCWQLRPR
ncbi:MAG: acetate kinase [Merismopediaceae bacterium]|nr:acetate kinase [Merismopediaceae bacterium]